MIAHKDPPAGKVGFIYMLRGGTDASNTDPFATKPEPNNNWIETGVARDGRRGQGHDAGLSAHPKPDTSQPYVMCRHALRAPDDPGATASARQNAQRGKPAPPRPQSRRHFLSGIALPPRPGFGILRAAAWLQLGGGASA